MAIWQHYKRVLSIFSPRMRRNGYLWTSGQKSDPAIRSGDLDFLHDRCISTTEWRLLDIFNVFVLLHRMTFWPWESVMYSSSRVWPHTNFYYPMTIGYWVTSTRISYHISLIWNSHCACAVSRDLCITKTTRNNFLTPNCLFTIQLLCGYDDD